MTASGAQLASRAAAIGLLLLLIAAAWTFAVGPALHYATDLSETIEQQRVLLGRLQAVTSNRSEPSAAGERAQSLSAGQFLEGRTDSIKAASLQSLVGALVSRSGGQLRTARALPPKEQDGLRLIGVQVQLTCFTEHMQELLLAIENATPMLIVDQLHATAIPPRGEGARHGRLDLRLDVFSPVIQQQ